MSFSKLNPFFGYLFLFGSAIASCDKDEDNAESPVELGSRVTVTNTFQSTAFTNGTELAIEDLFQVSAGSLAVTSNVSDNVEFPAYLLNLYDIDIDENSITFEVAAASDDPTYGDLFRILEPDTFDRYYFTFDEPQNVKSFSSSNASVNLRLDSANVLVVEIGEGYDFNPDQAFTITLK